MASLFVIRGRDQGRHYTLQAGTQRIGREAINAVQLLDSEASRAHAEIRSVDGTEFELIDLGSSNGTFVNGQAVKRHLLRSGDRVQIGQTLMIFTGAREPSSLAAAHGVDIVQQSRAAEASRIVSSLSQSLHPGEPAAAGPDQAAGDRSLEVMYLTALAVGRTTEIPELLDRVLRLVFDWVEADRGCIMLRDQQSQTLRPAARCDRKEKSGGERMAISRTILDYVIDRKEGVRTSDALDDQRWDAAQSIVQAGIREAMCVPLQGRYSVVGAMYVDTFTSPGSYVSGGGQSGRFTDQQLRLMTAIGYQAALAIEDTFYYSALVQSERLAVMGQTIANLSHHIKNILQGIRGGSYLIEAGLSRDDPTAVRRGWGIVEKNQERISNLVMDMLSFSKERHPERIEADLNDTVADVIELMQSRAGEANCQLVFSPSTDAPAAFFDPEALHRAILNIVTNAIDAAAVSETPNVAVRTAYDPQRGWLVEVADSGPGISPADRDKIFSPFESSKGARGTGLGLPVSKKIMLEHGGAIEVEDAQPQGTLFRLVLPPPAPDVDDQPALESRDTLA